MASTSAAGPAIGATGGVGGVGPDTRHPYVIRRLRVWDAHWAVTLDPPDVLIDGLDVAHSEFGFWRPRYERHAYRNMKFHRTGWSFFAESGHRPDPKNFPAPLAPIDDRPPFSVITRIDRLDGGTVRVRGVSVDDQKVRAVHVNGHPAKPLDADYLHWEVDVHVDASQHDTTALTAAAEDEAGHVERIPHQLEMILPRAVVHSK